MEFLEKLYSQEYFAPILFTIIAILAVLFIIVLILALRDAKKKKGAVDNTTTDAFAKTNEEVQEINVNVSAPEVSEENKEEEKKEESVINSVEPTAAGFENVEVPAPVAEENETPISNPINVEPTAEIVAPASEESQDIKIEATPEVVTPVVPAPASNDVEKAENDLDSIAATLLSEYQKDGSSNETKVETPSVQPATEFSSVGITPNTLPVEEENKSVEIPGLNDIPVPQPVRVTETSTVIDSSKQNVDNIPTEEYNLNK